MARKCCDPRLHRCILPQTIIDCEWNAAMSWCVSSGAQWGTTPFFLSRREADCFDRRRTGNRAKETCIIYFLGTGYFFPLHCMEQARIPISFFSCSWVYTLESDRIGLDGMIPWTARPHLWMVLQCSWAPNEAATMGITYFKLNFRICAHAK